MLERYYRINQAAGVSIRPSGNGNLQVHVCTIVAEGKLLTINKKVTNLDSIEKLKEVIPPKAAIALNISGKPVLQKKIERIEIIDQIVFGKLLPNSRLEDFYVQNFSSGESSFISVIRKTEADKWISHLNVMGFQVHSLSLGPYPLENILPQLNVYEEVCVIDGYEIRRNSKGEWIDCKFNELSVARFPFKVESEHLDEHLLVPYAAAFQLVMALQLDMIQAENGLIDQNLKKKIADNKLRAYGAIVLLSFFILLLTNFILFSWLNSANAGLLGQVSSYEASTNVQEGMNAEIQKKEGKLHDLGWDGNMNKSVLIDQLCSVLPNDIDLNDLIINPVDQAASRIQHTTAFYSKKIRITGLSQNIIPVNEWIARMKIRPWVKNARLESFSYDNELNTGRFLVSIDY